MNRLCVFVVFGVALLSIIGINAIGGPGLSTFSNTRLEHKYSFKPPFYLFRSASIPFWDFGGSALINEEFIRMTPSIKSRYGWLWNKRPAYMESWEVVIKFHITGEEKIGADGIAFWYTKESKMHGETFGNQDDFVGLGIFLDTFNNDGSGHNNLISAMINDGTKKFHVGTDGIDQTLSHCRADLRNSMHPLKLKINYSNNTLQIDIFDQERDDWSMCLKASNIELPTGYFFGMTAVTGSHADKHDVYSFTATDLNPKSYSDLLQKLRDQKMEPVASGVNGNIPSLTQQTAPVPVATTTQSSDEKKSASKPKETPPSEEAPQANVVAEGNRKTLSSINSTCISDEVEQMKKKFTRQIDELKSTIKRQSAADIDNRIGLTKEVGIIHKHNTMLSEIIQKQNDQMQGLGKLLNSVESSLRRHKEHVTDVLRDQVKSDEHLKSSVVDLSRTVSQLRDIITTISSKQQSLVSDFASDIRQNVDDHSFSVQMYLLVLCAFVFGFLIYAWKTQKISLPY